MDDATPIRSLYRRIIALLMFAGLFLVTHSAMAAGPSPTTAPASALEDREIRVARPLQGSVKAGAAGSSSPFSLSMTRVGLALLLVLGVIFFLKWAGRRMLNMPGGAGSGPVQVLSRSILTPRQQLMLIQVGKRIVVVANSGANVNPICEISDPEEVAALVGQIQQRPKEGGKSFIGLFGKAGAPYEGADEDEANAAAPEAAETNEELGGLLDKVRSMTQQFRQT